MDAPNILLITVDSLRKDALGCYGGHAATPVMDGIAAEGACLEPVIATAPYTAASFPGMFYGELVANSPSETYRLSGESLAQHLGESGYTTGGFHSNPYLGGVYGYDDGFDRFEEFAGETAELAAPVKRLKRALEGHPRLGALVRTPYYMYTHARSLRPFLSADVINDSAIPWIESAGHPSFAWVHYMDAHHPYMPDETGYGVMERARLMRKMKQGRSLSDAEQRMARDLYHRTVEELDARIGNLLEAVPEETLVVLTADHGEAFGEHGAYIHPAQLYDELLQVPFLVSHPVSSGHEQYSLQHLKQFIASALEGGVPDAEAMAAEQAYAVAKDRDGSVAVARRTPDEKYIERERGPDEYYDLEVDPSEQTDRIGSVDPASYRGLIDKVRTEGDEVERGDEVKQRLRDLGYEVE